MYDQDGSNPNSIGYVRSAASYGLAPAAVGVTVETMTIRGH
jgi:hypothetical protein